MAADGSVCAMGAMSRTGILEGRDGQFLLAACDAVTKTLGYPGELLSWNDRVAELYLGPTLTARLRGRMEQPA